MPLISCVPRYLDSLIDELWDTALTMTNISPTELLGQLSDGQRCMSECYTIATSTRSSRHLVDGVASAVPKKIALRTDSKDSH
eukprot:1122647-Pyramimonas_sp.AAC.1